MCSSRVFGRGTAWIAAMLCALACAPPELSVEEGLALPGRLQVGAALGGVPDAGFDDAVASRPFEFPGDHGAHPSYRSEWWYLTCVLRAADGRRFGVQFTVFRQALSANAGDDAWRSGQIYMAHVALSDVARGSHDEWQRFARGRPELAGARAAPFAVWLEDWRLASTARELFPLVLEVATDRMALDLALSGGKPIVLQGEAGLSRKGEGEASYYYSFPRIDVAGTLRVDGETIRVSGLGWLDREWSTSTLSSVHVGWDWFALHLDDGSDVMAFRLRRKTGERDPYDAGAWIGADGATQVLGVADFALTPVRTWRDERGVEWPVTWRIDGARWPEPLFVEAVFDDQRMDTMIRYWEGLVDVKDERGKALGAGYMELTGYTE